MARFWYRVDIPQGFTPCNGIQTQIRHVLPVPLENRLFC